MELYTGLTQDIYLDVYEEDELRLADSNPTVSIYDGDTDVLIISGFANPEINDEGHYSFRVLDNYVMTDKSLKAVWSYAIDGNPMTSTNYYSVVTPYLSISEAYSRLHAGREEGDQNYIHLHEMQQAEKFARFMVENYTGVKFGKYTKTITAYGQDADVLYLGERIISYTTIKENGKTVIDTVANTNSFNFPVEITDTNHSLRIVSLGDDINEGGKLDIVYPLRGNFYNGYRYDITGVFGWKFVPEKVQQAMIMLMKDYFGKDNIWRARFVQNVSYGDTDMEFSKLAFRGTGNFYADKLLDEFKSTNMAVI
jgi:hypothetical protein